LVEDIENVLVELSCANTVRDAIYVRQGKCSFHGGYQPLVSGEGSHLGTVLHEGDGTSDFNANLWERIHSKVSRCRLGGDNEEGDEEER